MNSTDLFKSLMGSTQKFTNIELAKFIFNSFDKRQEMQNKEDKSLSKYVSKTSNEIILYSRCKQMVQKKQ